MKVCWLLGMILVPTIYGCTQNVQPGIDIMTKSFKIRIPFTTNNTGIIIDTYWGTDKIWHSLLWDNHSPTWANENVINNNRSISLSKNFFYSTTTADGTPLHGNIYNCDSISVVGVTFVNVPFYKIPGEMAGVFGENLISKGVWEINFKKREMIFASDKDSLQGIEQAELFASAFTKNGIDILIHFRNNKTEEVALDFGFNGGILLPALDFLQIARGNTKIFRQDLQFSTPGSKNVLETTDAFDTIRVHDNIFTTLISTNKFAKEKLLGRGFFEQFEFVVLDYKNKLVYVSKRKR
jgi:hypothetical protein